MIGRDNQRANTNQRDTIGNEKEKDLSKKQIQSTEHTKKGRETLLSARHKDL